MGRKRVIKINREIKIASLLLLSIFLFSCQPLSKSPSPTRRTNSILNTPESVDYGYGRVLHQNPIILSGNASLNYDADLNQFLKIGQDYITTNSTLKRDCSFDSTDSVSNCFKTYSTLYDTVPLAPINGKWAFDANSDSFLQVHTYYHVSSGIDRFLATIQEASTRSISYNFNYGYESAISTDIGINHGFWYLDKYDSAVLTAYSKCKSFDNAYFSPSDFSLCFGNSVEFPGLRYAEDPSIIYHELGHAFVHILMNSRNIVHDYGNITTPIQVRSQLGSLAYDEAKAINEGLADYFTYVMTGRTHIGEWALKAFGTKYLPADRPMSEDDPVHAPGISTDPDSRLSYPEYLHYDWAAPGEAMEDVHYAGQIVSHFMVALTKDLINTCTFEQITDSKHPEYNPEHIAATKHVTFALAETLSEIGDLTAAGNNESEMSGENFSNLHEDASYVWTHLANPPSFRRFFQTFSRYLREINAIKCSSYTTHKLEQLMDSYGLLLFKNYNIDGGDRDNGQTNLTTDYKVDAANRTKTVLISKSLISLPTDEIVADAYVFDSRDTMVSAISNLSFNGQITTISDNLPSDLRYNNANGKISPGEVVGVALNLFNYSNSTMAGVQVLANDWDHMKNDGSASVPDLRPCQIDGWPASSEGVASADAGPVEGDCGWITRTNATDLITEPNEILAPICMVQMREDNETLWVSQDTFRKTIPIEDVECLDSDDTNSCLIRALPGADNAYYSKIDPQKNFMQTLQGDSPDAPYMKYSNMVILEVSKDIPPGTIFNCRFRVRFSNCSDCYVDPTSAVNDDYRDFEYAGSNPFKVINFTFSVIN